MTSTLVLSMVWLANVGTPASAPLAARTNLFDDQYDVRIHRPARQAQDDAQARRQLARLDKAVMETCGASDTSLPDVKSATCNGPCWHRAMSDAVMQVGDPKLASACQAYRP